MKLAQIGGQLFGNNELATTWLSHSKYTRLKGNCWFGRIGNLSEVHW